MASTTATMPSTTGTAPLPAPPNPHAGVPGVPSGDPHAGMTGAAADGIILTGSPFASEAHIMQAALVRRGRSPFPESRVEANASVPQGTIAVLVTDGKHQPLPKHRVVLNGTTIVDADLETAARPATVDGRDHPPVRGHAAGASVHAHQPVVIIEAMKMEHAVVSPIDGTLATLAVTEGQQVQRGEVLGEVAQSDA